MDAQEFTGKNVEEAIESGLSKMGLTIEQVEVEVLEEPTKSFLGIGKKARVLIREKLSDGERAEVFLNGLFNKMGINAVTNLTVLEDRIVINVVTGGTSAVIGYRGEMLDSLQCLTSAVANTGRENYIRLVVDCEGYRSKREDTLKRLAEKTAEKAVRIARKISLEPMNAYERRIIHSVLCNNPNVKTMSVGIEPQRFIVIVPVNYRERGNDRYGDRQSSYGNNRNYGGNRYGDRNNGSGDRQNTYGDRNNGYGDRQNNYGDRNNGSGDRQNGYGDRNNGNRYGDRNNGYGDRNNGNRYGDRNNRNGYDKNRQGGFSSQPNKKRSGFGGTYLGNSFKND